MKIIRTITSTRGLAMSGLAFLMVASTNSHASVVYNFNSAPIVLGVTLDPSGNIVTENPSPVGLSSPLSASLTFASALAANSVTQVSSESGGFDFIGPVNQGGLVAYTAEAFFPWQITSDINQYVVGSAAGHLSLARYSSVFGSVTTDASGNISEWDLSYVLYDNQPGGFVLDTTTNTIDTPPGIVDALLHISSAPASPTTITNVIALNGVGNNNNYTFNAGDSIFGDPGSSQVRYYTGGPGAFNPVVSVPVPGTPMLVIAAVLAWLPLRRNRA